ncbi:MAG TPA: hypothetical protein VK327_03300 [Candidatus Paceibacterota bacterium]|nr:hypothetical protein [Candidatus Paceibacterota bacterium]
MQFELSIAPPNPANNDFLIVGQNRIPIIFIQSRRARRYILRLKTDGIPRVTVPRGGTVPEARQFAERNRPWLERQFQKLAQRPTQPAAWTLGTEILFRG